MLGRELYEIKDTLEQVCKAIVSVLGVDITIVDDEYRRISGTGRYANSLGTVLHGTGVFHHALVTRKSTIVENPRAHKICIPCNYKEACEEIAQVCTPILCDGTVIGVMGLAAFEDEQKKRLLSNTDSMLDFVENMAFLIGSKAKEHKEARKVAVLAGELRILFDTMENAIFTTDLQGRVLRTNRLADEMLELSKLDRDGEGAPKSLSGERLALMEMAGLNEAVSLIELEKNNGHLSNIEFIYGHEANAMRGLVSVKPVKSSNNLTGYLFTLTKFNQVLRVLDAVSGGQVPTTFEDIIGESHIFTGIKQYATAISRGGSTVLIQGETGTGKELFARAIHTHSQRKDGPFVAINCAAIPESLIESELFGYDDGAFTGARKGGKMGKFELASKGTIFLDEIGDMPLNLQTKLLRVLQEGVIERIGGTKPIPVNVRVVAATNKDLERMVNEREFREDLFYRLNVMPLHLPSLKERIDDLTLLSERFLMKYSNKLERTFKGFDHEVLAVFKCYSWPGNIRELENTVEYMVNIGEGPWLKRVDLPRRIREAPLCQATQSPEQIKTLSQIEREHILRTMAACETVDEAARVLGMGRATLFRKLKQFKES